MPAYFIHEELGTINEWTQLPEWAWVLVASVFIFLISRLHEYATEFVDRLLDRDFHHAKLHLTAVGRTIQRADSLAEIERLLVEEPTHSLGSLRRRSFARRMASSGGAPAQAGKPPTPTR